MKRMVASAAAFAFAGITSIGLAGPAGAQEPEEVHWDFTELDWNSGGIDSVELPGELSPDVAAPQDEITVTGECNLARLSDPRHPHELRWALVEEGTFPGWDAVAGEPHQLTFDAVDTGVVEVPGEDEDDAYMWEATFQAPTTPGDYQFVGVCVPIDMASYPHCSVGLFSRDLTLEVEDVPPTTAPPTTEEMPEEPEAPEVAPPAVAVPAEPDFTG